MGGWGEGGTCSVPGCGWMGVQVHGGYVMLVTTEKKGRVDIIVKLLRYKGGRSANKFRKSATCGLATFAELSIFADLKLPQIRK
jgi:hypothetical protein